MKKSPSFRFTGANRDYPRRSQERHSFAPQRDLVAATWIIDGSSAFAHIYSSIKQACSQIFISDWMMSPEIALIRQTEEVIFF